MGLSKFEGICKGNEKDILYDVTYSKEYKGKGIPIIFIHGFKGYKDWGAFNQVAPEFAKSGFFFIKFNFSFNGTNKNSPLDFVDLNAFGNNNFSRELSDLDSIINLLNRKFTDLIDLEELTLIAHSRGGATALIKAVEDDRIKKVITWASVGTIKGRMPQLDMIEFERTNVIYIPNSRTNQNMPIYYQFVEDYYINEKRYDLINRCENLKKPCLIIHGESDETVPLMEAKQLHKAVKGSKLIIIEKADHSFGAYEPWTTDSLPITLKRVISESMKFLNS